MLPCVYCNAQSDQSQVASTLPAQHFKKKRGVVNGLVFAGAGLGGAIISFTMNGLLERLALLTLSESWAVSALRLLRLLLG
jgi:hypothetical protein